MSDPRHDPKNESALVALGSNMPWNGLSGDRLFAAALQEMQSQGLSVRAVSSLWQSPAWPPGSQQPDYLNAVARIGTAGLTPHEVLGILLDIENHIGRVRSEQWGPRTLDLDLIAQGERVIAAQHEGDLILPHPRMHVRGFVLAPLLEVAPDWVHPVLGLSPSVLLAACNRDGLERVAEKKEALHPSGTTPRIESFESASAETTAAFHEAQQEQQDDGARA